MRHDKAVSFLRQAFFVANEFSKDPSTKVGCLLLSPSDLTILSQGYNGMPRKLLETPERWERPLKYLYVRHAERNAIDNAARSGTRIDGCICVVTFLPCMGCAGSLIQVGCTEIVTPTPDFEHPRWGEEFRRSNAMFTELGIALQYVDHTEINKEKSQ
jgi:dCMP deaminase